MCQVPCTSRQFLNDETACTSYPFGCKTAGEFAVVDAHSGLVENYLAAADSQSSKIVAVIETHVQADHLSGLPQLIERTGATPYMPEGSGAEFARRALADRELVELGNTVIEAIATAGHAPAHHSYLVTDHRRGEEPWFVLTGDSLLVGDVGRPDLHAANDESVEGLPRTLYRSLHERLLALPAYLLVYPAHYSGSVCGRGLSGHPGSNTDFERRHNDALAARSEEAFVEAVLNDIPPAPEQHAEIVAANRSGEPSAALA